MKISYPPIALACLTLVLISGALPAPGEAAGKGRKPRPHTGTSKPAIQPEKAAGTKPNWVYNPGNSPLAADVDGRPITKAMIEQKDLQLVAQDQPPQDSTGVKFLLEMMVQKAHMGWLLADRGYTRLTPHEDSVFAAWSARELRNLLHSEIGDRAGRITRQDVHAFWERQKVGYRARLIAVDSRPLADSLHEALLKSADFTKLAVQFSQDPTSRAAGGRMEGKLTVGFMPAPFESVLTRMRPGQTSDVRPMGAGFFYIFRLDSLQALTTQAFEMQEAYLGATLARSRRTAALDAAYAEYALRLRPIYNEAGIKLVLDRYTGISLAPVDSTTGVPTVDLRGAIPAFTAEERQQQLLVSSTGSLTISDLLKEIQSISPMLRPAFRSADHIRHYAQTIAMYGILDEEVHRKGVDTLNYVRRELDDHKEFMLAERFFNEEIQAKTPVPEDSARAYYNGHLDWFVEPPQANVRWIAISDSTRADSVYKVTKLPGRDLESLVGLFSEDASTQESGGLTGFFPVGAHDSAFDREIFKLKVGEMPNRPLLWDGSYYVVKMVEMQAPHLLTWDEAAKYARQRYAEGAQEIRLQGMLEEERKKHPVRIYPEVLRTVRLGREPDTSEL